METHPLIFVDRSRTTTDWGCQRRRYLQYHYDGRGIVSGNIQLELFLGTTLHDALAAIAISHPNTDIDLIASTAATQVVSTLTEANGNGDDSVLFAHEQASLIEGLLRGYFKVVWPRLIDTYPEIVAVEQEMTYKVGDRIVFMSKPDLILGDREGNWTYVEFKSTSSKKEEWINSWGTAVQVHSTVRAVEETLGKAPIATIVQGLYKGYVSYGKQSSPLCYAYRKSGAPPFTTDQFSYDYKPGYRRHPVWELDGGVKAWIDNMSDEILMSQFPQTPPIFVKDELIDSFFAQRQYREQEIAMALGMLNGLDEQESKDILDISFQQKWDQCFPAWGRACPYREICHSGMTDPLSHGWEHRVPHHTPELLAWEAENEQSS